MKKPKRPKSLWEQWSDVRKQQEYEKALKMVHSLEHACVDYSEAINGYEQVIADMRRALETHEDTDADG